MTPRSDPAPASARPPRSRRDLLQLIGAAGGAGVLYQAMTTLGFAQESGFRAPPELPGRVNGSSILILGAGWAGLVAAHELRKAGWQVQVLEYQDRPGGRAWTVRGGDQYTELGGFAQTCRFDQGQYLNPGPWRIPHHHYAILHYARQLKVPLEPFVQVNRNALLHNARAYGGKPMRWREIEIDFYGHTSELLAKAVNSKALDQEITGDDAQALLAALRSWGALDQNDAYRESLLTADRRGYAKDPGGGVDAAPRPSKPLDRGELFQSGLWRSLSIGLLTEFQTTMFQPVGGMDTIAHALARELEPLIRLNAHVTEIRQDGQGVQVTWRDRAQGADAQPQIARADWCICTIPLTVLSQMPVLQVGNAMRDGIDAIPYDASAKIGLQFKRRFWEEDEAIFGGISYTSQSISQISYPSHGMNMGGKGVLLAAYPYGGPAAFEITGLSPEQRIERALEEGSRLHPQYRAEYENGFSVGWHRVPWILGCAGSWTDALRERHYASLAAIDGRLALAGEHISYIPAWQEGAILSGLDAAQRIHRRAVGG